MPANSHGALKVKACKRTGKALTACQHNPQDDQPKTELPHFFQQQICERTLFIGSVVLLFFQSEVSFASRFILRHRQKLLCKRKTFQPCSFLACHFTEKRATAAWKTVSLMCRHRRGTTNIYLFLPGVKFPEQYIDFRKLFLNAWLLVHKFHHQNSYHMSLRGSSFMLLGRKLYTVIRFMLALIKVPKDFIIAILRCHRRTTYGSRKLHLWCTVIVIQTHFSEIPLIRKMLGVKADEPC